VITHYKQLDVWVKAMEVAEAVYAAVKQMPKQEEYRLTSQMLRAAVSVPANIAEGNARASQYCAGIDGRTRDAAVAGDAYGIANTTNRGAAE